MLQGNRRSDAAEIYGCRPRPSRPLAIPKTGSTGPSISQPTGSISTRTVWCSLLSALLPSIETMIVLTQTAGVDGLSVEREIGFLDRVAASIADGADVGAPRITTVRQRACWPVLAIV